MITMLPSQIIEVDLRIYVNALFVLMFTSILTFLVVIKKSTVMKFLLMHLTIIKHILFLVLSAGYRYGQKMQQI